MISNQQSVLWKRRNMYLTAYDQIVDAGSFCANFLIAIFDSLEFGLPTQIDVISTGHYIALTALGCSLAIEPREVAHLASFFDITTPPNHQPHSFESSLQATYPSLVFLQPIVWFSESCLVDLSTTHTSYRQIFLHGVPSTQVVQHPRNGEPPRISFCLTLPAESFGETPLLVTRLKRIVSLWQTRDLLRGLPEKKRTFKLHLHWQQQAEDYFTLKITPKPPPTLSVPFNPSIACSSKQTQVSSLPVG